MKYDMPYFDSDNLQYFERSECLVSLQLLHTWCSSFIFYLLIVTLSRPYSHQVFLLKVVYYNETMRNVTVQCDIQPSISESQEYLPQIIHWTVFSASSLKSSHVLISRSSQVISRQRTHFHILSGI